MLQIVKFNSDLISSPVSSFLTGGGGTGVPDLIYTPAPGGDNRYPIRLLAMGIPYGVTSVINELHVRGFAEVAAWSPPMRAQNPDEIIRVMTRHIVMNS